MGFRNATNQASDQRLKTKDLMTSHPKINNYWHSNVCKLSFPMG